MAPYSPRNKLIRRLSEKAKALEAELKSFNALKDALEPEADLKWSVIFLRRVIEGLKK